ncbi:MAG: cation diffusion facilitator family transporter [Selenomonadaceae bacterium]|jgi:cation diffusion facilitator family transporter
MTERLIKKFIADYEATEKPRVRENYGILSGCVGIAVNLLLFLLKIAAGMMSGAISIIADAFNNLSDAGSSIVTLLGFKLAGKPADEEHPFGHGRMEYLAGLFISVAIILVGVELFRSSVGKIWAPESLIIQPVSVGILVASIVIKLWLGFFYKNISRRIKSAAVEAAALDSFNDCKATGVVLLSLIVYVVTGENIDGAAGALIAGYIFYSGALAVRDTVQPLLGQAPEPEFVADIEAAVTSTEHILGVHDLIVHDYGPGRCFVSLHAEISAAFAMMKAHEIIDAMEDRLRAQFHCPFTIHMDPIDQSDPMTMVLSEKIAAIVRGISPQLDMHDFRLTHGGRGLKLIFDIGVPAGCPYTEDQLRKMVQKQLQALESSYVTVIKFDRMYLQEYQK